MKPQPLLALCVATLLSGCAGMMSLKVSDQNQSPALIQDQRETVLVSQKKNTVVARLLTPKFSEDLSTLPAFFVTVANGGTGPINFRLSDIHVSIGSREVPVVTESQMISKLGRQATDRAISRSLGSSSQSAASAAVRSVAASTGPTDYHLERGGAFSSPIPYSPGATAAMHAQMNADLLAQMAGSKNQVSEKLRGAALMWQQKTIPPGTIAGGVMKLNPAGLNKGDRLRITVSISSEQHEFLFEIGE